jgi:transposase
MANRRGEELTDEQWELIGPLIPEPVRRPDGRGRPWRENREVLDGVLWILRSGARWQDLPARFPPYQTCHRRYQQWVRAGVLRDVLEALAQDLKERGELDLSECFIDGTFIVAKKGANTLERPSGAKARSSKARSSKARSSKARSSKARSSKARSSWQYQTLLVFLSPCTQRVLRRMRSPLCSTLWSKVSLMNGLST